MNDNKLLDESPLLVLPSLARAIGLQPAILMQQLHWNLGFLATGIEKEKPSRRGEKAAENLWRDRKYGERLWYGRTVPEWIEDLPWMSARTFKRTVSEVKGYGVIVTSRGYDKTNHYSIDYDRLRKLGHYPWGQIDPFQRAILALSKGPEGNDGTGQDGTHNIKKDNKTDETTTESELSSSGADEGEIQIALPERLAQLDDNATAQVMALLSVANPDQVEAFLMSAQESEPKTTLSAMAIGLAKMAAKSQLSLPAQVQEAQRIADIEGIAQKIIRAARDGHRIVMRGEEVEVDADGVVIQGSHTHRLRALIAGGEQIQIA